MTGYYRMHRGWMDSDAFVPVSREPLCHRAAWVWLIEHAAWTPQANLQRGQLSASLRYLASAWGWGHEKVRRSIRAWAERGMIVASVETGQFLITICKYEEYQYGEKSTRQPSRQRRDSSETNIKEPEEGKKGSPNGEPKRAREAAEQMLAVWCEECGDLLGKPQKLSASRITHCSARLADLGGDLDAWRDICRRVRRSHFLTEKWKSNLDWVLEQRNFLKVQEGNYDDRVTPLFGRKQSAHDAETAAFEFVTREPGSGGIDCAPPPPLLDASGAFGGCA